MKNYLYDSNVIITGSSSGFGLELTKILIEKYNCNVLGIARREEKLIKQKTALKEFSHHFSYLVADVSKLEDWRKLREYLADKNYNIIINNAGTMLPFLRAQDISIEDIKRVFDTNFFSTVFCINILHDYFLKQKNPAIINISSAASVFSVPGQSAYTASKSALSAYSKILHSENKKIFVGTYLPGFTLTNIFTQSDFDKKVFDEKSIKIVKHFCTPLNKMANKIVRNIERKRAYKVIGKDAKLLRFLGKIAPVRSSKILNWLFNHVNISCFEDFNAKGKEHKDF